MSQSTVADDARLRDEREIDVAVEGGVTSGRVLLLEPRTADTKEPCWEKLAIVLQTQDQCLASVIDKPEWIEIDREAAPVRDG